MTPAAVSVHEELGCQAVQFTTPAPGGHPRTFAIWPFVVLLFVGVGLRLHRLDEQFLLDDEFHALMAAARHPLGYLASHFLFAANSIPVNLYTRWLLDFWRWDEASLRLPSIVAGIGLLLAAWSFARRRRSAVEGMLIVGLLATAPLLVYYARITRPYALLAWLSFVNTTAAHRMLTAERPPGRVLVGAAIAWGLTGGLAAWVHQVAAFAVVANLSVLAGGFVRRYCRGDRQAAVREAVIAGGVLVVTGGLLLGPAIAFSATDFAGAYRSNELYGLDTLQGFLQLALGTGWTIPLLACAVALMWGAVRSWQHDRWWLSLLLAQGVVHFAALALFRAPDLHSPIVLARYALSLVPLLIVTTAMGWAHVIEWLTRRTADGERVSPATLALIILLCSSCVAWGPLPATLARGGNFMHHAAWQETYRPDPRQAFGNVHRPVMGVTAETLSRFYALLAAGGADKGAGLIEYPFPVGHNYCLAAFAQQHHGRPVWGGYVGDVDLVDPPIAFIRGLASPGTVARAATTPAGFRFKRFVDLRHTAALRATQARYLVVHLQPVCESRGERACSGSNDYPETDACYLARLAAALEDQLGRPIYADEWLRVFDLRNLNGDLTVPSANATSLRNKALQAPGNRERLSLLTQAAACSPDDPQVPLDAGIVLLGVEDYRRALTMFELVLEKAAGERSEILATAHDGCGVACYRLGHLVEARRHFKIALEHRPGDQEIAKRIEIVERALRTRPLCEP